MTWRNSKADSIVWIVEGNHDRTNTVFARIYVPKTITVFGIFFELNGPPQTPPVLFLRPAVFSSEAFFILEGVRRTFINRTNPKCGFACFLDKSTRMVRRTA